MKKQNVSRKLIQPAFERLLPLQDRLLSMGPATEIREALAEIAEEANQVMGGHFCVVMPYDQSTGKFLVDQFTPGGHAAAKSFKWSQPRPDGTTYTILDKQLVIVEDYEKEKDHYPFLKEGSVSRGAFRDIAPVRALIGVGLEVGGEKIGVLVVNYREPHHFSDQEKQTAKFFASLAANAIRNVRLFESQTHISASLKSLIEIFREISAVGGAELENVLRSVVEAARGVLEADLAVLFPYDEQADEFLMEQSVAAGEGVETYTWNVPRREGATRKVLTERKPMLWSDVNSPEASLFATGAFKHHFRIESGAGIPLLKGDEALGVLYINYCAYHVFSQAEQELIQIFADVAAVAIQNARLYKREQDARKVAETLGELSRSLTTLLDLPQVLDLSLEQLARVVQYDGALIGLVNEHGLLESRAARGFQNRDEVMKFSFDTRDDAIFQRMSQAKQPLILADAQQCQEWKPVKGVEWVRSWVGVPLIIENQVIGQIGLYKKEERFYKPADMQIVEGFAGQIVIAVRNATIYESERRAREVANTLRVVGSQISQLLDLRKILIQIVNGGLQLTNAQSGVIYLFDPTQKFITEAFEIPQEFHPRPRLEKGTGITRTIITTKQPVIILDVQSNENVNQVVREKGVQSLIGLPLQRGDQVIGSIYLNYLEPRIFRQEEINSLLALCEQAVVAIENARLYAETRKYADDLARLLEIAQDLTGAMTDPGHVLQATIERTVGLFDVTRGAIVLYENSDGRVVAAFDIRPNKSEIGVSVRFPDSPLQQKMRSASPVILADVETDELLSPEERERFLEQGIRTSMILPLVARGRVLGSLGLDETRRAHEFSLREQELARLLAGLAAVAIDNARIYGVAEKELSSVIQVAQNLMQEALRPGIELKQFLQQVMQQTLSLIEFNAGWLLLQEGDWVRIVATDELHLDDIDRVFLIEDCVSGLSMLRKDAINIPDLTKLPSEYERVYKAPRGGRTQSELVVPLMVGDRAIGAFNVESDRTAAFEPRHVEMLKLLSNQVALAIELARFRAEAAALSSVGLDLARETEMGAVVRSGLTNALKLVQGQFGQVLLREGEDLVVRYTTNTPPKDMGLRPPINGCVSGLAVIERKPVIVPDVDKSDYSVVEWVETPTGRRGELIPNATEKPRYRRVLEEEKERMHAELAVPLFSGDAVVGVLNLETPRTAGFTLEQRATLESFAVSNAERFAQALTGRRELMGELLNGALARADTGFGQLLRLDGETLIIEYTTGGEQSGTRVSIHRSVTGRAVREGKTLYVPDVGRDLDYQRYLGGEMKSELVVPLMIGEDVIGVLNVESPIPRFFTPDHARVLETFAGQAAVAIDRAKRFEIQTLAEVGGVSGDIVHRLNNPLGAIGMRLELLKARSEYPEMISKYPYLDKFIEVVELNTIKAKSTIQELRTAIKGKASAPTDLQPAIHEALSVANLPENIQVEQSLPDLMIRVIANDRLVNIFWNLFDNARKAMPTGGRLTITASISADDRWVAVEVRDTGQGIEPWRLPLIFEAYETTTKDPNAPGHGLGLWWVKAQLENFGGEISVDSKLGVGTWVTVKLKKAV